MNEIAKEQATWDRMFPECNHYYCVGCGCFWYLARDLDNPAVVLLPCPEHEIETEKLEGDRDESE